MASHQCVASLGFALGPISILFTLFYFRVLWMENLESRLWSLRPCLGLLIKCIGSLSLSLSLVKNINNTDLCLTGTKPMHCEEADNAPFSSILRFFCLDLSM